MSTAHRYLPKYTLEDYRQWKGDWELWQGIPISMTPSPFGPHQKVATRLITLLQNSVDSTQCEAVVLAEIDWIVSDNTVVRPDVLVLCGDAPARHVEQPPALIAEIVSPSTENLDRDAKFNLYCEQGVGYYLIIEPAKRALEIFKLDDDRHYQPIDVADEMIFEICGVCRLSIRLENLFA